LETQGLQHRFTKATASTTQNLKPAKHNPELPTSKRYATRPTSGTLHTQPCPRQKSLVNESWIRVGLILGPTNGSA
jgi:hypothetical protein